MSMTHLSEKLRLLQINKSTRCLSSGLSRFSLATLRLCSSLARFFLFKTLYSLFSSAMDSDDINLFSSSPLDDSFLDFDSSLRPASSSSSSIRSLLAEPEKLYLVPFRFFPFLFVIFFFHKVGGFGGKVFYLDFFF